MAWYRKKPAVVEAIQFDGMNYSACARFMGYPNPFHTDMGNQIIFIETLEGEMAAHEGDYIIRGVKGEYYPCKPDIFRQTYELV